MNPRYVWDKMWHVGEVCVTDDVIGIWTDDVSTDLMCNEDDTSC